MEKLNPCRYCGKSNIAIERWRSGGMMYMCKCNNPDCPVPTEGYPKGRDLEKVKEEWNIRNTVN
jgi:hypothetical protein